MTTKFNVGDAVYVEEGFEMGFFTISKINIDKYGITYNSDTSEYGYDESSLHRTEKKTFIEMLKGFITGTTYYSKTKVPELENLRNELLEVIARYED